MEGSFGEDRKLQRVIFLSSPNPNRSLHQSAPLSASLPEHWDFRLWPFNGALPVLPVVGPEAALRRLHLGTLWIKLRNPHNKPSWLWQHSDCGDTTSLVQPELRTGLSNRALALVHNNFADLHLT